MWRTVNNKYPLKGLIVLMGFVNCIFIYWEPYMPLLLFINSFAKCPITFMRVYLFNKVLNFSHVSNDISFTRRFILLLPFSRITIHYGEESKDALSILLTRRNVFCVECTLMQTDRKVYVDEGKIFQSFLYINVYVREVSY